MGKSKAQSNLSVLCLFAVVCLPAFLFSALLLWFYVCCCDVLLSVFFFGLLYRFCLHSYSLLCRCAFSVCCCVFLSVFFLCLMWCFYLLSRSSLCWCVSLSATVVFLSQCSLAGCRGVFLLFVFVFLGLLWCRSLLFFRAHTQHYLSLPRHPSIAMDSRIVFHPMKKSNSADCQHIH